MVSIEYVDNILKVLNWKKCDNFGILFKVYIVGTLFLKLLGNKFVVVFFVGISVRVGGVVLW